MKLLRFRYILPVFILSIWVFVFAVYAAVLFDNDDSLVWYGPVHNGYSDNQATVSINNSLDGGDVICPLVHCGDGIINWSDICDKGDTINMVNWWAYGCNNSCIPIHAPVCWDGIKSWIEFCDDGVDNNHPGYCNDTCSAILPKCWNNIQEEYPIDISKNEVCDKWPTWGMIDSTHFCSHSCKIKIIVTWFGGGWINCWDDEIDPGEICDEWSTNGSWEWHCRSDCSGIEPISCVGCLCDNSCPVAPTIPGPVVNPPTPSTTGNSSDSFGW